MKSAMRFLPCLCLALLAACGPNKDIPGNNGTSAVGSTGGITQSGTTGVSGGAGSIIPIHSTSSGGNANTTTASTATGTVNMNGTIDGNSFVAQDAVFGVNQTQGGLVVLTVVIGDQPNLCQFLAAQSGAANLVIAYLSSTNPNTYPVANTYPVVDPNGNIPDSVTNDSAFSEVAFAGVGDATGTFANAGQIQVTTSAANVDDPEEMSMTATTAGGESAQGTLTPAYCNILSASSTTSTLVRPPTLLRLH